MAVGDYVGSAEGTLSATGPGTTASVDITVSGTASGDFVALAPTATISDATGPFIPYVSAVDTNTVTVSVDRPQLPSDMTVRVIVFDSA